MTMKALVFHGPRDASWEDVPRPKPGPGEVLCRVAAVGVCATDIEVYLGVMVYFRMGIMSYPIVAGHEWSGIVEEVGEGVVDRKPGDRVIGETTLACGHCEACAEGRSELCWPRREVGLAGKYQGAMAEYVLIPAVNTFMIPDGVSLREAALAEPAGVGLHGLDLMRIMPGDDVVVIGDGPIGALAAQLAKIAGAPTVVLLGSRDYKMSAILETGIDAAVSRHDADAQAQILAALGGKQAHAVIETSGNAAALEMATRLIRLGGKLLILGLYGVDRIPLDVDYLVASEIQVVTSLGATPTYRRVLRMMEKKQLNVLPLQSEYPFARIKEAVDDVTDKRARSVKTLVVNPEIID